MDQAQIFVDKHGRLPVLVLVGGALAALGTLLPVVYANNLFGGLGTSYSLIQGGFYGFAFLAAAIVLGIFPIFLKSYARFGLAVFGSRLRAVRHLLRNVGRCIGIS